LSSFLYTPWVGIAQSVQRQTTGSTSGNRFPANTSDLSNLHSIQTSSEAHNEDFLTHDSNWKQTTGKNFTKTFTLKQMSLIFYTYYAGKGKGLFQLPTLIWRF
jgi:hypothetical protein